MVGVRHFDRITVEPSKMGGEPCIRGYRLTAAHLVRLVADGRSLEQIREDFPFLEVEDVREALLYAAEATERSAVLRASEQDLTDALLVLSRAATDSGRRTSLDAVIASLGLTREQLESMD